MLSILVLCLIRVLFRVYMKSFCGTNLILFCRLSKDKEMKKLKDQLEEHSSKIKKIKDEVKTQQ